MKRLHEIYNLALSFFIMVPKRRILPIQQGYWMSDSCGVGQSDVLGGKKIFWWEDGFMIGVAFTVIWFKVEKGAGR